MNKDKALDLALKALRFARDDGYENEVSEEAITAIKQARSAPVQEPVALDVTLDGEEAKLLRDMLGDDRDELSPVRLLVGNGHSGHGLYAAQAEYQEEGAVLLATTTPPTQPAPNLQAELDAANRQVEILSDALAESRREVAALKINAAFDKKAENARELGLDYEPPCKTGSQCTSKCQQCVVQEPVAGQPLPCPFCGHIGLDFGDGETYRWGIASCGGCGASCTDVRREYPDQGQWHTEAIAEWNKRSPAAQPAPVQEAGARVDAVVAKIKAGIAEKPTALNSYGLKLWDSVRDDLLALATPPAAQRQWVGLTDEEANELWESTDSDWELMKRTEAKLRERNGG